MVDIKIEFSLLFSSLSNTKIGFKQIKIKSDCWAARLLEGGKSKKKFLPEKAKFVILFNLAE